MRLRQKGQDIANQAILLLIITLRWLPTVLTEPTPEKG